MTINCSNQAQKIPSEPGFYYWKSLFSLTQEEKETLKILAVKKIYVKFFDIDWQAETQQIIPLAIISWDTLSIDNQQLIPTVFITNRTFLHQNTPTQLEALAQKTSKKIQQLALKSYDEIQFDCDWSLQTKAAYFSFLEKIKKINPQQKITCTIRLHQVKFATTTGIPPCESGVLMLYNTGDLENNEERNSIFNSQLAKNYLQTLSSYPLRLDVAFAIFQWGVVQRDGKVIWLLNNLSAATLADQTRFKAIDAENFEVLQSTYVKGYYLYQGDKLRLERAKPADLSDITTFIRTHSNNPGYKTFFYSLDSANIRRYGVDYLKKLL